MVMHYRSILPVKVMFFTLKFGRACRYFRLSIFNSMTLRSQGTYKNEQLTRNHNRNLNKPVNLNNLYLKLYCPGIMIQWPSYGSPDLWLEEGQVAVQYRVGGRKQTDGLHSCPPLPLGCHGNALKAGGSVERAVAEISEPSADKLIIRLEDCQCYYRKGIIICFFLYTQIGNYVK